MNTISKQQKIVGIKPGINTWTVYLPLTLQLIFVHFTRS